LEVGEQRAFAWQAAQDGFDLGTEVNHGKASTKLGHGALDCAGVGFIKWSQRIELLPFCQ
jgi:hypothetical protein